MEPNKEVIDYICKRTSKKESELNIVKSDKDAIYSQEMTFDITDMEPQIACPNDVDNVCDISKIEGTSIDQCLIGSCTNGRMEVGVLISLFAASKRLIANSQWLKQKSHRLAGLVCYASD